MTNDRQDKKDAAKQVDPFAAEMAKLAQEYQELTEQRKKAAAGRATTLVEPQAAAGKATTLVEPDAPTTPALTPERLEQLEQARRARRAEDERVARRQIRADRIRGWTTFLVLAAVTAAAIVYREQVSAGISKTLQAILPANTAAKLKDNLPFADSYKNAKRTIDGAKSVNQEKEALLKDLCNEGSPPAPPTAVTPAPQPPVVTPSLQPPAAKTDPQPLAAKTDKEPPPAKTDPQPLPAKTDE